MATYRELLQQTKSEIDEVDAGEAQELLSENSVAVVDVRERDEWDEGHLPRAIHVPRGNLESRIERAVPDKSSKVLLYCAAGNRSAFAAKTLEEFGKFVGLDEFADGGVPQIHEPVNFLRAWDVTRVVEQNIFTDIENFEISVLVVLEHPIS